jgi:hypothetical protein
MTKNKNKISAEKKFEFFFDQKLQFTYPRPPYRSSKLQKKPSGLKRGHPTLQNMNLKKKFYFCGSFLPSWIQIRISNPLSRLNTDPQPCFLPKMSPSYRKYGFMIWKNPFPDPGVKMTKDPGPATLYGRVNVHKQGGFLLHERTNTGTYVRTNHNSEFKYIKCANILHICTPNHCKIIKQIVH